MRIVHRLFRSELLRGSGMYLIASIVSSSIPFVLLPVLTRYLTPSEYGEVAMFTVFVSFLSALCGLSVHGAANRKYFDYKDERPKLAQYIFMCTLILLASSLALFATVILLSPWISELLGLSEEWVILGVPVAALGFLTKLRLGQWQVEKKPFKYGTLQISQSMINAALSVLLVVGLYMGVTGRILGIVISTFLFSIIALVSLLKEDLIVACWKPEMAKEALRFGIPLIPHILGLFLISSVDRIVITGELGLAEAGVYMVAIQLSLAASLILAAVNQAFVPWLFERLKRGTCFERQIVVRVSYGYYLLLAIGVFLGFWIGDDVLKFVVGPDYYDAAELIGWVILAKGFHGGYLMVTNYLFYAKRTGVLSSITITTGLLNVILLFVFINQFGLMGAVWAYCISQLIQWLATWVVANRIIKMPWLSAF